MAQLHDTTRAKTIRLVTEVEADLYDEIDVFWHVKRLPSRTAAVKHLLWVAIELFKIAETQEG